MKSSTGQLAEMHAYLYFLLSVRRDGYISLPPPVSCMSDMLMNGEANVLMQMLNKISDIVCVCVCEAANESSDLLQFLEQFNQLNDLEFGLRSVR